MSFSLGIFSFIGAYNYPLRLARSSITLTQSCVLTFDAPLLVWPQVTYIGAWHDPTFQWATHPVVFFGLCAYLFAYARHIPCLSGFTPSFWLSSGELRQKKIKVGNVRIYRIYKFVIFRMNYAPPLNTIFSDCCSNSSLTLRPETAGANTKGRWFQWQSLPRYPDLLFLFLLAITQFTWNKANNEVDSEPCSVSTKPNANASSDYRYVGIPRGRFRCLSVIGGFGIGVP